MLIEKVYKFIHDNSLFEIEERVLVCVSGGVDSMVLLDVLLKLCGSEKIGVAHCNFGLRGSEADRESDMVIKHCQNIGIECHVARFDTPNMMLQGESIQMAARRLRYDFFEKIASSNGYGKIVIAHNFDDKIETFFINLTRGAGIGGLKGMAVKSGLIVRPLLCVTRSEIANYAKLCGVKYMNDSSNAQDKYLRNNLRHNVLPLMRDMCSFDLAMSNVFDNLSSQSDFLEQCVDEKLELFEVSGCNVDGIDKYLLYRFLDRYGFDKDMSKQLYGSILRGENSKRFYSDSYVILLDRGRLVVEPADVDVQISNFSVSKEVFDANKCYRSSANFAYFDADKLGDAKLFMRFVKGGDWFVPFGMKGRRLVNDFLKDEHLNLLDKRRVLILCANEDILWIAGLRTDNRFCVDNSTKTVLKVTL